MELSLPGAHLDPLLVSLAPPLQEFDEKNPAFDPFCDRPSQPSHSRPLLCTSQNTPAPHAPRPTHPYQPAFTSPAPLFTSPATSHTRSFSNSSYTRPRGLRIWKLIKSWIPLILYALTSLGFVVAITLYKTELFQLLDDLSFWLRSDEYGQATLFFLIFLTTIPPFPLYSTLIILSGYTFGPWTGAIISYFAALAGALFVFVLSRFLLRNSIARWLNSYPTIKRVVRAIEKRPKLLFLIRLAPYPYNVMNCLLAASPSLTLHTYTVCTALSLFKVIIHTSLGASIHSFREYHIQTSQKDAEEDQSADTVARMWTGAGILLCILILVYLSIVARRAVDDELDDDEPVTALEDNEERMAFLSPETSTDLERGRAMAESPFRSHHHIVPDRALIPVEPDVDGDGDRQWS
ncbi:Golgi apparatus membrane protein TVP38 [Leucoagaricus sp. SymC.cos]|nr:Golgi apparatus membrane protein TVP38 [Leucoagaricus sp. SymC.cos]